MPIELRKTKVAHNYGTGPGYRCALSFRRRPSSRCGEALWEREAAGSGSLGAASSESAAGSVLLRGCWGCGRGAAVESAADSVVARRSRVFWWVWMVVRFVCVIRVPDHAHVCQLCVPAPHAVFLPVLQETTAHSTRAN